MPFCCTQALPAAVTHCTYVTHLQVVAIGCVCMRLNRYKQVTMTTELRLTSLSPAQLAAWC